jgi:hypothetical protein
MTFDRKSFLIGVLTLSAAILTLGHLEITPVARASETIIDDDYQLVTARVRKGDDGIYVLHKRKNLVALFTWDAAKKGVVVSDVRSLDDIMSAR